MESDDDFELLPPADSTSPPVHARQLKRLKKAAALVAIDRRSSQLHDNESPKPPSSLLRSLYPESQSPEDSGGPRLEGPRDESSLELEPPAPDDLRAESDFIGSEPAPFDGDDEEFGSGTDGSRAKRVLEFDPVEDQLDARRGDGDGDPVGEGKDGPRSDWPQKGQSGTELADGGVQDMKKGRKRKKKGGENCAKEDEKHQPHAANKRRPEKERRDYLKQLRADSQKLLRETQDAAFKPVPLVQKPISSILEKIRQRKLELSKKSVMLKNLCATRGYAEFLGEDLEFELEVSHNQVEVEDKVYVGVEENVAGFGEKGRDLQAPPCGESDDTSNESDSVGIPLQRALEGGSSHTFRAPINDTQELFSNSQSSEKKICLPDETPKSLMEEVFAPSLLAMNLKFDSAPQDDMSDEENNDKENADPNMHQLVDLSLSPKGDPVKDFIDEEAEEEDNSDDDLCFQDNEEEDIEDAEELNEMIAADYKEKPIDNERRNQLHQEWLKQQDAAGTENLMQRLNCGLKQRDTLLLDLKEDEKDVECEEDEYLGYDDAEDSAPANTARMNMRKAKQMISEAFTDKNDAYMSSDDEEFETRLTKQSFRKSEVHISLTLPAEDESSREVFDRIKKLNMTPDNRKKPKTSSRFDASLARGKTIGILKPSFLGRGSNPLPSSKNHKTSMIRTYIFGRDDSNSKSTISALEDSSDMIQEESRPKRTSVGKYSSSQSKSSTQITEAVDEVGSNTTLYDILSHSSVHSDQCARETIVGQTESMFAAFRLRNKSKSTRVLM